MSTPTYSLWPALPPQLANDILLSIQKSNKKLYRTAVEVMAPRMGVRVPILLETPKTVRHATWIQLLGRPDLEVLSFNLFSTWLIDTQTPMLCAWLDSLGIEHAENGCADTFPPEPSEAALKKGVDGLLEKFDSNVVAIYLRSFNCIDETDWAGLDAILKSDKRLEVKKEAPVASA